MRRTERGRSAATAFYLLNVLLLPITAIGCVLWLARLVAARRVSNASIGRAATRARMCTSVHVRRPGDAYCRRALMATVFLVEDDLELRSVLVEAFESEGYAVRTLLSVERLLDVDPVAVAGAVAVVDGWGSSSLELSESGRAQLCALGARLPTIVLTGRAWADRVTAEELGLWALFPKPTDLEALLRRVESAACAAPVA
jgi:CheY-like chemotaxis protein